MPKSDVVDYLTWVAYFCLSEYYFSFKDVEIASRNPYTVELHFQMLEYTNELKSITAKEFYDAVGIKKLWSRV